jgi:DNA-3-methyladenine glycosylase I
VADDGTARSHVVRGDDGVRRCAWGASTPDYAAYHDREWGFPVVDDVRLYEKLSLEGFQPGLSWLTILRKREAFRRALAGFEPARVAGFGERDITRLLGDAPIVRHRGKIEATIANARATLAVQDEHGSLAALVWSYEPRARRRAPRGYDDVPPTTPESTALAKELKRFGFRFVGPTTAYAAMQAVGVVNDHFAGCSARAAAERARRALTRPVRTVSPRQGG